MKLNVLKRMLALFLSNEGATATEYAVILALIIVVLVVIVASLGLKLRDKYWNPSAYGPW
jgi:Flp pilus assembly pilin Flp